MNLTQKLIPTTTQDHRRVVAIDGPAAAGKTTVARLLAGRLGVILFDTGVLYRAVTLVALRAGIAPSDHARLTALASDRDIDVMRPSVPDGRLYDVWLDGEDVTWAIRGQAVEEQVSQVAAHAGVRDALLPVQRRIADGGAVVMVGRDVGTVVVPDAGVKIFLLASVEERAQRRHRELAERGIEVSVSDVLADLRRRDAIDSGRAVSPLRAAPDAIALHTDGLPIEAVVDAIEREVRQAWAALDGVPASTDPTR